MRAMRIVLDSIGIVHSPRSDRSDDCWGSVESTIELDDRFLPNALAGLSEFSHVEIVFVLHDIDEDEVENTARHPRNNPQWPKVGIFAQRGARRPNRLGVSRARLLRTDGRVLYLRGLDANDGSPVLDIKPYMQEFGPVGDVLQPRWASELMKRYYQD